jgi:hypothetical protein
LVNIKIKRSEANIMSGKDFSKKHPPDKKVIDSLAQAVRARAQEGEIACAVAFEISAKETVPPGEVGFTLDKLGIKVMKCQLGLYGYKPDKRIVKPAETVSSGLEKEIRNSLINGRLPCAGAWEVAKRLGLRKMEVSAACETLGVKISACQLGSF